MFDTKSIDPSLVTFTELKSPGVRKKNRLIIPFSEIYVPSLKSGDGNKVRTHKNIPHIQRLEISFTQGIDYSQMPPTVIEKARIEDGDIKKYELVTGNHSFEAMKNIGYTEWVFDIYEIPSNNEYGYEDSIRTFQLKENNDIPKLGSSHDDVTNTITRLIAHKSKLVYPDEDSIVNYVDSVCTYMHFQTRQKIVRDTLRKLKNNGFNVYTDYQTYTPVDVKEFLDKNTDLVSSGNYDFTRNKVGWSILEGYEYEILMNAVKKYHKEGKESYFTIHTKRLTDDLPSAAQKRKRMLESIHDLEQSFLSVFEYYSEHKKFPWEVMGALPQDILNGEDKYIYLK